MIDFGESREVVEDRERWEAALFTIGDELSQLYTDRPQMPPMGYCWEMATDAAIVGASLIYLHPDEDPVWWDLLMHLRRVTLCFKGHHDHVMVDEALNARMILVGLIPCSGVAARGLRAAELGLGAMHVSMSMAVLHPLTWRRFVPDVWESTQRATQTIAQTSDMDVDVPEDYYVRLRDNGDFIRQLAAGVEAARTPPTMFSPN